MIIQDVAPGTLALLQPSKPVAAPIAPSPAIKAWAEDERPREKLQQRGAHHLTDAELLAILLGSGSANESAVALARRMLHHYGNDIGALAGASLAELTRFKGIGQAKAITVQAAFELGRRRELAGPPQRTQLTSSACAYHLLRPHLVGLDHEECWVLCLSRSNHVLQKFQASTGGRSGTVVDPKIIFLRALEAKACAIILAHNHPSGQSKPSQADIDITRRCQEVGKALDMPLLDHIIVAGKGYYSFADEKGL